MACKQGCPDMNQSWRCGSSSAPPTLRIGPPENRVGIMHSHIDLLAADDTARSPVRPTPVRQPPTARTNYEESVSILDPPRSRTRTKMGHDARLLGAAVGTAREEGTGRSPVDARWMGRSGLRINWPPIKERSC